MGFQKIFCSLLFYSFFMYSSQLHGAMTWKQDNEHQYSSDCSRLIRYSALVASGLLTGSLTGYLCGQFDQQMGFWSMIFTWPTCALLRDALLMLIEQEIHIPDQEESRQSCLDLMKAVARLAEWVLWLKVMTSNKQYNDIILPFPIALHVDYHMA